MNPAAHLATSAGQSGLSMCLREPALRPSASTTALAAVKSPVAALGNSRLDWTASDTLLPSCPVADCHAENELSAPAMMKLLIAAAARHHTFPSDSILSAATDTRIEDTPQYRL